jgi:hypothetical protein
MAELVAFYQTAYIIEFMRLAEPPLPQIKQPSAFHVASTPFPALTLISFLLNLTHTSLGCYQL